ncbi:conserved hypothetical protein [Candidatus Sulfopaludibacter sp. SbA3]|nr:conserved hypothetical protein [Candidatus Sulfopaludibacter sp. SbA3]
MSFEEFERLPDRPGKRELLGGEVIEWPPAEFAHNEIADRICDLLKAAVKEAHASGQAANLGRVYHEMGYRLGTGYLQPDVSVTHAGQTVHQYLEGAPAIAIEVVSPGNRAEELDSKVALYFEHGGREVWRVYPKTKHVMVHVNGKDHVTLEDIAVTTPLLPGFKLAVVELLDLTV